MKKIITAIIDWCNGMEIKQSLQEDKKCRDRFPDAKSPIIDVIDLNKKIDGFQSTAWQILNKTDDIINNIEEWINTHTFIMEENILKKIEGLQTHVLRINEEIDAAEVHILNKISKIATNILIKEDSSKELKKIKKEENKNKKNKNISAISLVEKAKAKMIKDELESHDWTVKVKNKAKKKAKKKVKKK